MDVHNSFIPSGKSNIHIWKALDFNKQINDVILSIFRENRVLRIFKDVRVSNLIINVRSPSDTLSGMDIIEPRF